jgi:sec-independent protein translocase protein TatC
MKGNGAGGDFGELGDSSLSFGGKSFKMRGLFPNVADNSNAFTQPTEAAETLRPEEKPMGFFQHLEELRWTLVKCAVVYGIFACVVGYYLKEFNQYLLWPWQQVQASHPEMNLELKPLELFDIFGLIFQVCVVGALGPAAPFMLYFVSQFIAPALTTKELKMIVPTGLAAVLLFLLGACLGFFILMPQSAITAIDLNLWMGFKPDEFTTRSYYSALTWLVCGVGLAFEFPLLVVLLVYLRLLSVAFLRKYRRHAVVVICIVAAVIPPTQDPVTLAIFAVPLYALYEAAVLTSALIERSRTKAGLA